MSSVIGCKPFKTMARKIMIKRTTVVARTLPTCQSNIKIMKNIFPTALVPCIQGSVPISRQYFMHISNPVIKGTFIIAMGGDLINKHFIYHILLG